MDKYKFIGHEPGLGLRYDFSQVHDLFNERNSRRQRIRSRAEAGRVIV